MSVKSERMTEQEIMIRLKAFVGVLLGLTLFGIVFVVLYSLVFVTQPLDVIAPIDQKFFELIIPIATFLTGTLSGIMLAGNSKEDQEVMLKAHDKAQDNAKEAAKATEKVFDKILVAPSYSYAERVEPETDDSGRKKVPDEEEKEK